MAQPRIGLLAVGFGRRALGRVAKQPVFSPDHEGADRAFSGVIVERQVAFLDVSLQLAPVTGEVTDSLAQGVLSGDRSCVQRRRRSLGRVRCRKAC